MLEMRAALPRNFQRRRIRCDCRGFLIANDSIVGCDAVYK